MERTQAPNIVTFAESIFLEDQMRQFAVSSTIDEDISARTIVTNTGYNTSIAPIGQVSTAPIEATSNEVIPANANFYEAFVNHYAKPEKEDGYFKRKLDAYQKDAYIRHTAVLSFDFQISDADKHKLMFETRNGIKLIWQFICLSYQDQELLMMDQRYQQYAKTFDRIHNFQVQAGMIAKADGPKVCKLFQFYFEESHTTKTSSNQENSTETETETRE